MIGICAFFAWGNLFAYQVTEMTLEEKSKSSDLVVIAKVLSVSLPNCNRESRCAKILITSTLKGASKGNVFVLFEGPISEFNPRCCEAGNTYLFFLEQLDDSYFRSMNGPFGIYPIIK
jgi:hypothetical protein